ncbi:NADPH:quinone reductase-like Zn-dependent oxidoreductase [Kribbella pratensis]|uniref:NADPH:quinone reductase-like Zn-dependent oxidoreductase n=1 Tax=Kribbella pratensis TaxID=2512112 RepID=A0ABY2FPC5_9ACTN|nr:NADP-dependent oxidoreductase [Kribbella pratensis]TDW94998.1 NADPH:quinone reductase-like Zn-dependent oxidoreductase [Kribbella pratensis]
MKAVRFHATGGPEVLRYEDAEQPVPGAGEVRIQVAGSAYNPADGGIRGGFLPIPVTLPHVPGYDVSGTIDALGDGVEGLTVGENVVGFIPMNADGSAAQYVVAPASALVKAPVRIPLADAAGLPSVGLTASQALFEAGQLKAGQRVLINGAGGPVGGYAVQLAKRAGAYVIATASPRSSEIVKAAGADEIIDHTATSVLDAVAEQVDVLLNLAPITPDGFTALVTRVRDGGVVVSTTPTVTTPGDDERNVRAATIFVHPDADVLSNLVALIDSGDLHVEIARRVPLSELPAIHQQAEAGQIHGKVVAVPPAV